MDIETAARLLEYRKKNGYSQEELAEKIGVSRQAISKWERSESSPDTDNLIALSKLYNVSLDELVHGKAEPAPEAEAPQDKVNIGLKGIDVQSAEGDNVHVGFDGIRVNAAKKGETDGTGIEYANENSHAARNAVISLLGLVAFLLTGFMLKWWAFNWTFLLFTICIITLFEAIDKRRPDHFAFPLFAAGVFCLVGITAHVWHPTWVIFIAIPFYYIICDAFKKKQ
jgi:HTH-type transcriptional regulator/antitoxin HipB